jgi:hypothetical protein
MENFTTGGKMPFLGNKAQRLQFVAAQIAKQSNGFKRGHRRTLYQFQLISVSACNCIFFVAALCERRWNQWRRSQTPKTFGANRRYSAKANGK